jgi:hypothetical protein
MSPQMPSALSPASAAPATEKSGESSTSPDTSRGCLAAAIVATKPPRPAPARNTRQLSIRSRRPTASEAASRSSSARTAVPGAASSITQLATPCAASSSSGSFTATSSPPAHMITGRGPGSSGARRRARTSRPSRSQRTGSSCQPAPSRTSSASRSARFSPCLKMSMSVSTALLAIRSSCALRVRRSYASDRAKWFAICMLRS